MSHYKPYPAYKDSGVEWLGKVPEGWKISAVKWDYELCLGKMLQPRPTSRDDKEVYYHKAVSVQWEDVDPQPPKKMWASLADIDAYHICEGDLLVCEGGDVGRAGIFQGGNGEPLIIQNSLHRVRPKHNNLNEYLLRILQTVRYAGWFDVLCNKATIVHFTGDKFGSLAFSVAPPEEQKAIVNYLNRETTRIDALVAKKTRFIELLCEKRQALITQAVTRGLDPNVKMKDSGVDWLGEVPEHWELKCLKHIARIVRGASPRPAGDPKYFATDNIDGENTPWLTVAEITKDHKMFMVMTSEYLTRQGVKQSQIFNIGTLVFTNSGATLGVPKILSIDCCANDGILAFLGLSAQVDIKFLYYFLLTTTVRLRKEMQKGGQPNLNTEIVKSIHFPQAPIAEQTAIVAFIDRETTRIDSLITKTQHSIDLLKERRAALITAAVTGQIDVRCRPE